MAGRTCGLPVAFLSARIQLCAYAHLARTPLGTASALGPGKHRERMGTALRAEGIQYEELEIIYFANLIINLFGVY